MDVHDATAYLYRTLGGFNVDPDEFNITLPKEAQDAIESFRTISPDDTRKTRREVAFVSVVGSINYETNDANSDLDLKATYFPCLEDFYFGSFPKFNIVTEKFDCTLAPLHDFRKHMLKGNINFFEPLYSKSIALNPCLENFWDIMKLLVEMNVKEACLASFFTAGNRYKRVIADGENYVGKDAAMAFRLLHFVETLIGTGEFNIVPTTDVKALVRDLRAKAISFDEVKTGFEEYQADVSAMLFKSFESGSKFVFTDAVNDLDKVGTKDWKDLNQLADQELIFALRELIV